MVNLQKIKNTLKNAVSGLSSDKKARLYFQDRKRFMKLEMEGQHKKAMEVLKNNDEFYKKHQREDPHTFHKAHHDYLNWSHDYTYFQEHQGTIAYADREKEMFQDGLKIIEFIESSLHLYRECKDEDFMEHALELIGTCKKRLNHDIKHYTEDLIPELERQIEENEYFREHDYFQDVDPIGYKNISWKEYLAIRCNIGTNNGLK